MAEIHTTARLTPGKGELVGAWMGDQRWYAAKGRRPSVRRIASFRFDDPAGRVGVETMLVADDSGPHPVLYQVPLTYRDAPLAGAERALVGTMMHSVLGKRWVYDAPHDPVYAAQLLACIQGRVRAASSQRSDAVEESVVAARHPSWVHEATVVSSKVLSGEQSNTSVILDCALEDGTRRPLIVKVFRTLQPGANPDVEVQGGLRAAGCDRVPEAVGHLSWSWPTDPSGAPDADGEHVAYGDLAFAQEFLPGVEDAWRVALRALAAGETFTTQAAGLGAATAEVHRALAEALGSRETTAQDRARIVAEMRSRHATAVTEAPALVAYDPAVERVYEAVSRASWPAMQRIHGDYHLGQVLRSPSRGWILLDFEGEPLRPLAERARPDQWLRDVAGMVRSFDYAGGSHELAHPGASARDWVAACQEAFLDGYLEESGTDPRGLGALLTAFELDKALYEVVYEARNRPTWLSIPLDAVRRLLDGRPARTGPPPGPTHPQEVTP